MKMFKKSYCFDDVLLVPQYSEIMSRSEIDLSSGDRLKNLSLDLPIVSSPMDTVTESMMTSMMSSLGGLGIIHRYNSPSEQASQVEKSIRDSSCKNVGFAIGVGQGMIDRARKCLDAGANVICIDIAHGDHALMRHSLRVLRNTFGDDIHIMAGNVATLEGLNRLADWGANSVRVGIGGGSICSTRIQTGHGMPTFQSIIECSRTDRDVAIVADGGIRNSGDIVKCLAAGADLVMLGSLLAGTDESPGEEVYIDGEKRKVYRGMASKDAQIDWRGHYASVEGVSSTVQSRGSVSNIVEDLERGIRSGLSYSGAKDISELQSVSSFVSQTSSGAVESSTHILK